MSATGEFIETEKLRGIVNDAGTVFQECHGLLRRGVGHDEPGKFLSFQSRLAKAIYSLEHEIIRLKQRERELARDKKKIPAPEVATRFRDLHAHIEALKNAIDHGKVIGDAFAWLFYGEEEDLIRSHYAHPPIEHIPIGVGGMGEIEFVGKVPKLGSHLVLYHGTTTFLRVGDVSLLNLKTSRIDGIAELKSKKISEGQMQVSAHYLGRKISLPAATVRQQSGSAHRKEVGDRLYSIIDRQTKGIEAALKKARNPPVNLLGVGSPGLQFDCQHLTALYDEASLETASTAHVSPGLMLVGIKLPVTNLAERVLNDRAIDAQRVISVIGQEAKKIMQPEVTKNSLQIGFLIFPGHGRYALTMGMTPVIWWPMRADVVEAIVSGRFMVMTLFNPAHLIDRFQRRGFVVTSDTPARGFKLRAQKGDGMLTFHGLDFFLSLIPHDLITEDSVHDTVCGIIDDILTRPLTRSTRIDLQMSFRNANRKPR